MVGQRHSPAVLTSGKRPGTHCSGGCVGPRVSMDGCGIYRLRWDSNPDRQARTIQLHKLQSTKIIYCRVPLKYRFDSTSFSERHRSPKKLVTADLKARIIAEVKNIDAPMLTRVCGKNLNIVSMCAVSPVVHTSNISSYQKKTFFSFPVAVNNSIKVGPLVSLL